MMREAKKEKREGKKREILCSGKRTEKSEQEADEVRCDLRRSREPKGKKREERKRKRKRRYICYGRFKLLGSLDTHPSYDSSLSFSSIPLKACAHLQCHF